MIYILTIVTLAGSVSAPTLGLERCHTIGSLVVQGYASRQIEASYTCTLEDPQ